MWSLQCLISCVKNYICSNMFDFCFLKHLQLYLKKLQQLLAKLVCFHHLVINHNKHNINRNKVDPKDERTIIDYC